MLPGANQYRSYDSLILNAGADSSFAGNLTAQGNGGDGEDFYYTPPTGYVALNTDNLSAPSIADPTKHFNTVLRTATGTSGGSVTGVGFQPDMIWQKRRSPSSSHYINDVVRGSSKILVPNDVAAESTDAQWLVSFDTDGYTIGNMDWTSGGAVVSWNWKAGTTFDPATAGSVVTGSGSSNATAGFSIVKYEGTGAAMTIGHGLSSAPELIIVKNMDAADAWQVGSSKGIDFTDYLVLNTAAAIADNVDRWNDTAPSASVFTVGDGVEVNTDDEDYIAYCFNSIESYSKVGSFVGNGDDDGIFIYTGFKPAFAIVRSASVGDDWMMLDDARSPYNQMILSLAANDPKAEISATGKAVDFVSNGIKMRNDDNGLNQSGTTFIYIVFAESPFKTSNAR